jgi:hypothetical protein
MAPIAFIFPNIPLPVLRRRDKARVRLQELVTGIIEKHNAFTKNRCHYLIGFVLIQLCIWGAEKSFISFRVSL